MNAHHSVGVGEPKAGGDAGAPVAALRAEAVVAEPCHQFDPQVRDSKRVHPALTWAIGEAVAGQRRDHHVERIPGIPTVTSGVAEERYDLEQLDERAGPAVGDDQRERGRPRAALVDKVDAQAADGGAEVREGVDGALLRPPVEVRLPVAHQVVQVGQARAVLPIGPGDLVGPAGARQPRLQVRELGFGDLDSERLDVHMQTFRFRFSTPACGRAATHS